MVTNAMLIIIGRALNMLKSQIKAQGKAFEETGGFNERLMAKRLEAREGQKSTEPSPECPQCSKSMRRRKSAKGGFLGLHRLHGVQRDAASMSVGDVIENIELTDNKVKAVNNVLPMNEAETRAEHIDQALKAPAFD